MGSEFYLIVLAGAAAGGFINGLAGFGTSLFALGFWLQIMPPLQAVSAIVVLSVVTGIQGVWLVRHAILAQKRRLLRFLIPAVLGIPIGVATLKIIDPTALKLVIAGFMILYGGFFTFRRSLPEFSRPTPQIDRLVGFLGGIAGGAASLSGALPTMWCSMRPWSKSEVRGVLQPYNVIVLGLTAALLAWGGNFTWETLKVLAVALPVAMLSAQIGIAVFKRLSDAGFRRLIIVLLFVLGVVLLLRTLL